MELNKINEFTWKIEKQGNMNVPAIIYSSDALMEKVKSDKTFQQIMNVACLKGIVKNAIAMPDCHEGYGFPIGGVAAFDMDEGIISPGGIGYDINCLHEDSEILTEFGYSKKIKDFEQDFNEVAVNNILLKQSLTNVKSLNKNILENNNLQFFMKKPIDKKMFRITTALGFSVKCTEDHPILTREGMVKSGLLKENNEIAILPFKGVQYQKPSSKIIVEDLDISKQSLDELRKRNLLPLAQDNPKLPYLIKLFGYTLGDGIVYFVKGKGFINIYSSCKEDLEDIQRDLEKIGYKSKIYTRTRDHVLIDQYGKKEFSSTCHELHISSRSLAHLLVQLGMPLNDKTYSKHVIPEWIFQCPLWMKRLFLASFFGAELSSPATSSKTGFYSPTLCQSKKKESLEHGRKFLIGIMKLLEEFDIKTLKISELKEYKSIRLRLIISAEENNLLNLWTMIGYEYNRKKSHLANIASYYIMKKKLRREYRDAIAKKILEYKQKGIKPKEIKELFINGIINESFIEKVLWHPANKKRVNIDFESFDELKNREILYDNITNIEEIDYSDYVYDFTVEKTHNFIANGIIVSNCSVRLLRTDYTADQILDKRKDFLEEIYKKVPVGTGRKGIIKINKDQLMEIMEQGARWAVDNGYGKHDDVERTEENGHLASDPSLISERAVERGVPQLGTLGSGNHFLELQKVDKIYDQKIAEAFGIYNVGQVVVMIHCGSRGLGHQVASDYIKTMEQKYGFADLPDRELINAPINSDLGQQYLKAMGAAANFAFANKQLITYWVRQTFEKIYGNQDNIDVVYDVCHNIGKFEKHDIDGERRTVCVHRKGATRSFGPGREEVPEVYREYGQPIIIPGSMGTASYILVGTKKAEEVSFGSTAHGAGRVGSRSEALRTLNGQDIIDQLNNMNIAIKGNSLKGIAEEAPQMYKDIDEVIRVSHGIGIGNMVARLKPLGVIKG